MGRSLFRKYFLVLFAAVVFPITAGGISDAWFSYGDQRAILKTKGIGSDVVPDASDVAKSMAPVQRWDHCPLRVPFQTFEPISRNDCLGSVEGGNFSSLNVCYSVLNATS